MSKDKNKDKDEKKSKSDDTGRDHKKSGNDDKHDGKHDDASGSGNGSGHGSGKGSGHGSGKGSGHGSGKGSHGGSGSDGGDGYVTGGIELVDDEIFLAVDDVPLDESPDSTTRLLSIDVLDNDTYLDPVTNATGPLRDVTGLSLEVLSGTLRSDVTAQWNESTGNFDLSWEDGTVTDSREATAIEFDYQALLNGEVLADVPPASVDIFIS